MEVREEEEGMSTTYYATDAEPQILLRRADYVDEAFSAGKWQPTKAIVDYMYGHDDNVDRISEQAARSLQPAAFI